MTSKNTSRLFFSAVLAAAPLLGLACQKDGDCPQCPPAPTCAPTPCPDADPCPTPDPIYPCGQCGYDISDKKFWATLESTDDIIGKYPITRMEIQFDGTGSWFPVHDGPLIKGASFSKTLTGVPTNPRTVQFRYLDSKSRTRTQDSPPPPVQQ